jgi:hypothetical protein
MRRRFIQRMVYHLAAVLCYRPNTISYAMRHSKAIDIHGLTAELAQAFIARIDI